MNPLAAEMFHLLILSQSFLLVIATLLLPVRAIMEALAIIVLSNGLCYYSLLFVFILFSSCVFFFFFAFPKDEL